MDADLALTEPHLKPTPSHPRLSSSTSCSGVSIWCCSCFAATHCESQVAMEVKPLWSCSAVILVALYTENLRDTKQVTSACHEHLHHWGCVDRRHPCCRSMSLAATYVSVLHHTPTKPRCTGQMSLQMYSATSTCICFWCLNNLQALTVTMLATAAVPAVRCWHVDGTAHVNRGTATEQQSTISTAQPAWISNS